MDESELHRIQALGRGGRREQAEHELEQRLREFPDDTTALRYLAEIRAAKGRKDLALELWRRLARLMPGDPSVLRQLANTLLAVDRIPEAVTILRTAVALDPANARGHHNLGLALMRVEDLEAARASLEAAIRLEPGYALAFFNLGLVAELAGNPLAACRHYERAVALDGLLGKARIRLSELLRRTDARRACHERDRALEAEATKLMIEQRLEEAVDILSRLIEDGSDLPYLEGTRFYCRLQCADWSEYEATSSRLEHAVAQGSPVALPFVFLAHSVSSAAQLSCASRFAAQIGGTRAMRPVETPASRTERIKIVYLSADLHEHATAYLVAGLLEHHDRSRFEVSVLSYGPASRSAIRARLESAVERFIDVRALADPEIATRIRTMGADIAIDLKGYTNAARPGVLAYRAAPVQISFLGFPGTMGAEFVDYLIADRHVIPPTDQEHYREKIIYLPHCYQPNDDRRTRPDPRGSRRDHGLPERGTVFCCFNQTYKITPSVFAAWMEILRATEHSVLWLYETNSWAVANLRAAAVRSGVSAERLIFARYVELDEHLARYHFADLVLDTSPYNSHTTASDALWMSVPVLTPTGSTFAGRVAASLLHAIGLPDLVQPSLADYVAEAIRLANAPAAIDALKQRLRHARNHAPLFDTSRYTRNFEAALGAVWSRYSRGEPAAGLTV